MLQHGISIDPVMSPTYFLICNFFFFFFFEYVLVTVPTEYVPYVTVHQR